MKDTIVHLLRQSSISDLLEVFWQALMRTTEPVRSGRKIAAAKAGDASVSQRATNW